MEPHAAADGGGADPDTGLEESVWRLGLGDGGGGEAAPLPERPGEADCAYYLRTGTCGYGERCRYNHPRDRGGPFSGGGRTAPTTEYPERPGQPVCEYFMKNGTCKFGSNCKYHHPRQGSDSMQPVILNSNGFPVRPGEKECSYYVKTGQCKFGSTCKFHHPELGPVSGTTSIYPPVQPPPLPSPHPYPPLATWQMGRPPVMPGSYFPGSYGPMVLSSAVIPMPGWNPYATPANQVASAGGQQTVQAGPLYGLSHQGPSSAVAYNSPYVPLPSSTGPSSSNKQEHDFPERPGQPECKHYMRTGDCKFGATCKYHHPHYWSALKSNYILSPLGLPLRPGAQPCSYYTQHGFCKFGPTCMFDHPMGTLSYSPSASSLADVPIAPYPHSFSVPTMAPSSLSSDLQPGYILTKDASANQAASLETTSGPIESILSKGVYAPHTLIQSHTSAAGGSSTSQGGDL